MSLNPHKYLTRKWIMMRMAAQEFSFKEPFDLDGEYSIMKSCLFLSMNPIELIFVFTYARLYGALSPWVVIPLAFGISALLSKLMVDSIKDKPFVHDTVADYEQMDYDQRKKLFSFWNVANVIFCTGFLPWLIMGIAIYIVCILVPL